VSAPLDTDVDQMYLSAGRRSATAAVGRFAAPRQWGRSQSQGTLYVLAAIEDDADQTIAQAIVAAVGRTYRSTQGSLTTRLRRAVQAGSAALLQDNLDLVSRSPRGGGVACAVLRDDDLYLAQVGAAVACVCQRGSLTRLADDDPDSEVAGRAFGRRHDPDVRLAYHATQAGDTVMLADVGLVKQVRDEILIQALSLADAGLSLDSLASALPANEGAILVVAVRRRGAPAPVPATEPVSTAPGERRRPAPEPTPRPAEPPEEKTGAFRPPPAGPTLEERLAPVREAAGRWLAGAGRVAGDWLGRLTPGEEGLDRGSRRRAERKLGRQAAPANHPVWRLIALILPVIVLLVAVATYWKRDWDRQARYDELMAEVDEQLEIAATADEAAARQALETTLLTLDEAAQGVRQDEAISGLRADVQKQLDTLNKVVRLSHVEHLYTYPAAGEADQIVVHGADIYILDRLTDRVYHQRLNETGPALAVDKERLLVRKGDQTDAATAVGELVGMAWMPGGEGRQTGALLILGRNGLLLAHDPTWERLVGTTLPASETWQYPLAVSGYLGNFYVLDPGLRQVLRYRASGAGYASPPDPYLVESAPDIADAIDMAIDGFVYLLFNDGRLEKYLSGEPVPLTLNLTDQPLRQPSAVYTAPDAEVRFLYVADPPNGRVLRCDKEGRLIQQFILEGNDALTQVRDIFVDEVGSRLYFLADNRLFVVDIPPP
jgi:hypothetical protein